MVINIDIPWNPAVLEQRIARVHRLGQKDKVQVVNLVSTGTIEHKMLSVLAFKTGLAEGILDDGEDSKGYVEVVPYTTRRPNIPELAWENKINGWVLVVFTVSVSGQTSNIRILDANPKGIFEEEVQKAISLWRYNVSAIEGYTGDRLLTQKVMLDWKNYPENVAYY